MEIIFVRHGESIANVAKEKGTSYDATNIPLTPKGIKQATQTSIHLSKIFNKFDIVITSPMLRCAETTEIILANLDYKKEIIIDDRLIESGCNYDVLEGLSKEQWNKKIPTELKELEKKQSEELNPFKKIKLQKQFRILRDKLLPYSPTKYEAWDNWINFLAELSTKSYKRVLIISHSTTMAGIMQIICGIDKNINWIQIGNTEQKRWMENCSIMCIGYDKKTLRYSLVSAPSDAHLSL
jgi:broad specificity phosphatase PhoE